MDMNLHIDNYWLKNSKIFPTNNNFLDKLTKLTIKNNISTNYVLKDIIDLFDYFIKYTNDIEIQINEKIQFLLSSMKTRNFNINSLINGLVDNELINNYYNYFIVQNEINEQNKLNLNTNLLEINKHLNEKINDINEILIKYLNVAIRLYTKQKIVQKINDSLNINFEQYIDTYEKFIILYFTIPKEDFILPGREKYLYIIGKYFPQFINDQRFNLESKCELVFLIITTMYNNKYSQEIINILNIEFLNILKNEINKAINNNTFKLTDINCTYIGKLILHNKYLFEYFSNMYKSNQLLIELKDKDKIYE